MDKNVMNLIGILNRKYVERHENDLGDSELLI